MTISLLKVILQEQSTDLFSTQTFNSTQNVDEDIKSFGLEIDSVSPNDDMKHLTYTISGPRDNIDRFMMHIQGYRGIRTMKPREIIPLGSGGYSEDGTW